jgi:hypothetical protein
VLVKDYPANTSSEVEIEALTEALHQGGSIRQTAKILEYPTPP